MSDAVSRALSSEEVPLPSGSPTPTSAAAQAPTNPFDSDSDGGGGGTATPSRDGSGAGSGGGAARGGAASKGAATWTEEQRREEAAQVADFLIREGLLLSALELHQELLERGRGAHDVRALNLLFDDSGDRLRAAMQRLGAGGAGGAGASPSVPGLEDVDLPPPPFGDGGSHAALRERDQRIALLEYKLRCAEEDMQAMRARLDTEPAAEAGGSGSTGAPVAAGVEPRKDGGGLAPAAGPKAAEMPPSELERRRLNCMIKAYLLARGYRMTAITRESGAELCRPAPVLMPPPRCSPPQWSKRSATRTSTTSGTSA